MNKSFWAIIAAIIIIFGGILLFNNNSSDTTKTSSNAKPTEHIEGESSLGITLVEYGDYECSYCKQFYAVMTEVKAKYNGQVKFQFRNLPLIQAHPAALAAARAAEAAGLQGKFWEMHDTLYDNQATWATGDAQTLFSQYASRLGLDVAKFKKDSASSKVNDMINADIAAFNKLKISKSTPTYLLNGKQVHPESISIDAFEKIIDPVIAEKQKS